MKKTVPHEQLKALGLEKSSARLFARYLDDPPGKFAEFWLGSIESGGGGYCIVDGRMTKEWEAFVSHASFQRERALQFGLLLSDGSRLLCTGYILSLFPTTPECIRFTIDFIEPFKKVVDTP